MFKHSKRLGQNFLASPQIAERIVEAAQIQPEDQVLEIGPGEGVLTRLLAQKARRVVSVELDRRLEPILAENLKDYPNATVVWGDFLELPFEELPLDEGPLKVVANIPYYITSPILQKLLNSDKVESVPLNQLKPLADTLVIMVQKEVADRMVAPPGGKDYGSLSVFCQYAAQIEKVIKVPAGAFIPPPKVDSAVVRLFPRREAPVDVNAPAEFFKVVRASFAQRRKTLSNCLIAAGFEREKTIEASDACQIDLRRRGETLSLQEFACLSRHL